MYGALLMEYSGYSTPSMDYGAQYSGVVGFKWQYRVYIAECSVLRGIEYTRSTRDTVTPADHHEMTHQTHVANKMFVLVFRIASNR